MDRSQGIGRSLSITQSGKDSSSWDLNRDHLMAQIIAVRYRPLGQNGRHTMRYIVHMYLISYTTTTTIKLLFNLNSFLDPSQGMHGTRIANTVVF